MKENQMLILFVIIGNARRLHYKTYWRYSLWPILGKINPQYRAPRIHFISFSLQNLVCDLKSY